MNRQKIEKVFLRVSHVSSYRFRFVNSISLSLNFVLEEVIKVNRRGCSWFFFWMNLIRRLSLKFVEIKLIKIRDWMTILTLEHDHVEFFFKFFIYKKSYFRIFSKIFANICFEIFFLYYSKFPRFCNSIPFFSDYNVCLFFSFSIINDFYLRDIRRKRIPRQ